MHIQRVVGGNLGVIVALLGKTDLSWDADIFLPIVRSRARRVGARARCLWEGRATRGMRKQPLHVPGVPRVDGGGDEVRHPHGGHVLAMDMGDHGARAHNKKRPRHWPNEGMPRPEAKGS